MRRNPTEAETRLWYHLRANRLNGYKFYRQVPIGQYIVDIINHEFGLVIEIDGATHGETHELIYDARRTAYLESLDLIIHRVSNIEIFTNMDGVLYGLTLTLEQRKTQGPQRQFWRNR